ncbi:TPA: hypothetical protein ACGWER_002026 [Streptococcus agalactiae]|nr:hypothetical protein [Streptococcus agalactiae]HEO2267342.1 hypothetical protein [Streptococcus agalactiae]
MIINTTQVKMVLLNKTISDWELESITGISCATISKYRKGEVDFEEISLKNIMSIQKWIDDGNFIFRYDYNDLISEIEADIKEGLVNDYLFVVRGNFNEALGFEPIVDYYYEAGQIEEGDFAERIKTELVLSEMKKHNLKLQ